ncbi:MAG: ankyrin repeat domain-containing protein [Micavibrio sp.]|nr:ankyrin repeat domain-containing protein [Micavibrio sp.]
MGILRNSFVNFSIAALGYPPEQTGEEVLRALREGRENDARRLVRRQPSVLTRTDDAGDTLMERCLQRDGDDAKLLADTFPQTVDGCDTKNISLLMRLAQKGRTEMFDKLLALGADGHLRDAQGGVVMHYAALTPTAEMAELVAKRGFGINTINNFGQTPLMLAARTDKQLGELPKLLALGMKLNLVDNDKLNATMHAMDARKLKNAQELMDAGGEVDFERDVILVNARADAHQLKNYDFLNSMSRRNGAQKAAAEAARKADAEAIITAQQVKQQRTADVAGSMVTGTARPIKIKTIRFKKPGPGTKG